MDKKLRQIMSNIFEIQEDGIIDKLSIETAENWDSLQHLNLILAIEEQFGISISEDKIIEMTSFVKIKRILRDKGIEI